MNSDISLKRNIYAQSIRLTQRQRIRKNMRKQLQQAMAHPYPDCTFDQQQFKALRKRCHEESFNEYSVMKVINYIFPSSENSVRIAEGLIIKFMARILDSFERSQYQPISQQSVIAPWKEEVIKKMKENLHRLITVELSNPKLALQEGPKNKKIPQQFSSLYILHNCFSQLIELVAKYDIFLCLWEPLSLVYNGNFKAVAFENFKLFCEYRLKNLKPQQLQTIIKTLNNFLDQAPTKFVPDSIAIIDIILKQYRLGEIDLDGILESLILILGFEGYPLDITVQIINKQTDIIQNMLEYLEKKYFTSYEAIRKICLLIGKIFYVQTDLCNRIYYNNPGIFNLLRACLPVQGKVTRQQVEDFFKNRGNPIKLSHSCHSCTNHVLYAIGNIVANGEGYASTFLNLDGFLCLCYFYCGVPLLCRRQICSVAYNMVCISDDNSIPSIMLTQHLSSLIQIMLGQTDGEILIKTMKMINMICKRLPVERPHPNYILATSSQFGGDLFQRGCRNVIQGLLCEPNEQISKVAQKTLQILDSIVPI